MAYRLLPQNGDSIRIPQLVFKNLNNGREDYFRVALYILSSGELQPEVIAADLKLKNEAAAVRALAFWQGAGLLEEVEGTEIPAEELKQTKPRLTTREVLMHSGQNPEIAVLMQEAQQIFGEVISQSGCSILASMYVNDEMPLDFLLLGLAHFAAQGFTSKKLGTVQRKMQNWQEQGVTTLSALEEYLSTLEKRRGYYEEVARVIGCSAESFNALEQSKINIWYEKYRYNEAMISLAFGMVGDGETEKRNVKYVNGIIKKWYGNGYRQPRDVLAEQQGSNAMPVGRPTSVPQNDLLQKKRGFVPKFRLDED